MPSTLRRTRQRVLSFTRSITDAFRSTISDSLFFDKAQTCAPLDNSLRYPPLYRHDISRPRQLRRRHIPTFHSFHFIHRLPLQLLAHIFIIGSEGNGRLPVIVSHVCKTWRDLALRTPALWRQIMLDANLDMWRERIYRARACTLDVHLLSWMTMGSGHPQHQFLDADAVRLYLHLVTPLIRRWRSLEIVFSEYSPFLWQAALSKSFSRSRKTQALMLEELSLVYRLNDDARVFYLFSGYAPKLRRVTLDGIRLAWLPTLFANLTYLDYTHHGFSVEHQAVHEIISILEDSARLVELKILFPRKPSIGVPTRSSPVSRRVLLPFLARLYLRIEGPDIPFEFAHIMTLTLMPCLTSLRLIDLDRNNYPFPGLKSFFYVFALPPSLQHLHVEHGWYDPGMVSPILQSLPDLHRLVVRRPHATDQVLDLQTRFPNRKADDHSRINSPS